MKDKQPVEAGGKSSLPVFVGEFGEINQPSFSNSQHGTEGKRRLEMNSPISPSTSADPPIPSRTVHRQFST
jgi:hypothetical protein